MSLFSGESRLQLVFASCEPFWFIWALKRYQKSTFFHIISLHCSLGTPAFRFGILEFSSFLLLWSLNRYQKSTFSRETTCRCSLARQGCNSYSRVASLFGLSEPWSGTISPHSRIWYLFALISGYSSLQVWYSRVLKLLVTLIVEAVPEVHILSKDVSVGDAARTLPP